MATARVQILSVGARTPLGLAADASAAAVRGALSAIELHPYFVDKAGEPMKVARDAALPLELAGVDRCVELGRSALSEALRPIVDAAFPLGEVPLIVGLPEDRPGRAPDLDRQVASGLKASARHLGVRVTVEVIPSGHAAGLMALDAAVNRITAGHADVCVVGGVDSYIEGATLEWLDENKQLMSGANRSGFPPGEAAAFVVVGSAQFARGASAAGVVSVCTTFEQNRIKTDTICTGEGLTAAIRGACAVLDGSRRPVEQTWCDLNGERYRTTEYTYALLRTQRWFDRTRVAHPADCWGDLGSASGPAFASLAVTSWKRGYAYGPRALLWTSSESGYRAAAVLQSGDALEPAP